MNVTSTILLPQEMEMFSSSGILSELLCHCGRSHGQWKGDSLWLAVGRAVGNERAEVKRGESHGKGLDRSLGQLFLILLRTGVELRVL